MQAGDCSRLHFFYNTLLVSFYRYYLYTQIAKRTKGTDAIIVL